MARQNCTSSHLNDSDLALTFDLADMFLRYSHAPPSFCLFPEATRSFPMVVADQQRRSSTIDQVDANVEQDVTKHVRH